MTSIYFIPIETRLVTHFSGCKTITLHKKAIFYVLNHAFSVIELLQNFVEVFILHCLLEAIAYSLCFKKQTLELLLPLSFKA